jgi:hypothetical protein
VRLFSTGAAGCQVRAPPPLDARLGGQIFDATGRDLPAFAFAVAMLVTGVVAIGRVRA